MSRYEVRARGESAAELLIYGDIGESWDAEQSNDAKRVVSEIGKLGSKHIDVRINSYGGVVSDGLAIHNSLRRHKGTVTTHIDGVAFSIASLIAMAGREVRMADNALLMIHAPWGMAVGNAGDMRDMADTLDKYAHAMSGAYVRDGGPDAEQIRAWLTDGQDHYFTAGEASEAGLVDEITQSVDIAAALRSVSPRFTPPAAVAAPTGDATMAETQTPAVSETVDPKTIVAEYDAATRAGREEGAKVEARRQSEIRGLLGKRQFQAAQVQEVLNRCLNDTRCDKTMALERALEAVEQLPQNTPINAAADLAADGGAWSQTQFPSNAPLGGHRQISGGTSQAAAGIRMALEIKAGVEKDRDTISRELRGNEFLSMSLVEMMAREMRSAGMRPGGDKHQIARAYLERAPILAAGPSHGTDHLTGILADVANKAAMMGWDGADETWSQWVAVGNLNDYREAKRANLALLDKPDKMLEGEEYEYGDMADVSQGIQGYFYGKKYGLTIQAIVNDDLGELTRKFSAWGEAANAKVGDEVFTALTTSGTGGYGQTMDEDSQILFHADHSNYIASGSGGAPSTTTMATARASMMVQTDPNGRTIGVRPRFVLHGAALTPTVWTLLNATNLITGADSTMPDRNWVQASGMMSIEDYRFDGWVSTAWMLAAARRTVEVAGVAGPLTPRVERSMASNIPGLTYELSMPFGVAVLDYRSMYLNYGA
jgi:ATP-dependent Clp endopeptidase proteolytic subunit ClpP